MRSSPISRCTRRRRGSPIWSSSKPRRRSRAPSCRSRTRARGAVDPAQPYAPPPPEERPGLFSGGGGLGSFLRSAGTTAAGVAGGELLFSGLSDLFGHRGGGMFGGGGQGFMGGPEEVVVNNYGDDDRGDDGDNGADDNY